VLIGDDDPQPDKKRRATPKDAAPNFVKKMILNEFT